MFSNHSFNALLKTLEEPPPHVKFLLATTDPQKLPATILSRCLQFNLKRLTVELIRDHLARILTEEGIAFDAPALSLIARAADGSMRDALSLLDQAIAYGAGTLRESEVRTMLGSIEQHHVIDLLNGLADGDAAALLTRVTQLAEQSPDFAGVLAEVISTLHRIALAQAVPDAINDEMADREAVLALAERLLPEDVQLYYQIALIGRRDLPLAPSPRGGFEMVLLRMLAFRPDSSRPESAPAEPTGRSRIASAPTPSPQAAIAEASAEATPPASSEVSRGVSALADVRTLLTGKKTAAKPRAAEKAAAPVTAPTPAVSPIAPTPPPPGSAGPNDPTPNNQTSEAAYDNMPPVPDYMNEDIPPANDGPDTRFTAPTSIPREALAVAESAPAPMPAPEPSPLESVPVPDEWETLVSSLELTGVNQQLAMNCALKVREGNHFELSLGTSHDQLLSKQREDLLCAALGKQLGETITIAINVETTQGDTPAHRQKQRQAARQRQAEACIEQDHTVQALRETFAAQVNPGSVRPVG